MSNIIRVDYKENGRATGFVLHGIPHYMARISAWYTLDGSFLSATYKRRNKQGNLRCVEVASNHHKVLARLRMLGKSWADAETPEKQSRLNAARRV